MKKAAALFLLFSIVIKGYSQKENKTFNSLGVSIPIVWNNSKGIYYQLGDPKYPKGDAISYGIGLDYTRYLKSGVYGKIGLGYFKQCFGIRRPFYYESPYNLAYYTKAYSYASIYGSAGIGYRKVSKDGFAYSGSIEYNIYHSFKQKYIIQRKDKIWQQTSKSVYIGQTVQLNLGIDKTISKSFSLGIGLLVPVFAKWNNDSMFIKSYYSENSQKIASNIFSAGIIFSCKHNF